MPDYKKPGFKKSFGAPRRDFGAQKKLYKAECSNCHTSCEVPFRPNGMKPVFCRNCFDRSDARDNRPSYGKKEFAPRTASAPHAPEPDRRIDDLKRQLIMLESKLDNLIRLVEAGPRKASPVEKKPTTKPKKKAKK